MLGLVWMIGWLWLGTARWCWLMQQPSFSPLHTHMATRPLHQMYKDSRGMPKAHHSQSTSQVAQPSPGQQPTWYAPWGHVAGHHHRCHSSWPSWPPCLGPPRSPRCPGLPCQQGLRGVQEAAAAAAAAQWMISSSWLWQLAPCPWHTWCMCASHKCCSVHACTNCTHCWPPAAHQTTDSSLVNRASATAGSACGTCCALHRK